MKKIILVITITLILAMSFTFAGVEIAIKLDNNLVEYTNNSGFPFIKESRTLVPLRLTLEKAGAKVDWDGDNNQALVEKDGIKVRIPINKSYIYRDNKKIKNDAQAVVKNGRTYLPIRVVMEALNYKVGWEQETQTVLLSSDTPYIQDINIGLTKGIKLLAGSKFKVGVALAKDTIGATDSLSNIAQDNLALVAINGSYFSAYTDNTIKDPYGILVVDGKAVHNANDRAVFGISEGKFDIDRVDTEIKGDNGDPDWKYSWNGYWINHSIVGDGFSTTIYTPERGETTKEIKGTNYIVEDNKITSIIKDSSVKIPNNGYVVNINGIFSPEVPDTVYDRFALGNSSAFTTTFIPSNNLQGEFWNNLDYAVGAGPALILDGKIDIDFIGEHFTETKITQTRQARSAVGYTKEQDLIIITTTATIPELANIMLDLGCYEAMNLDGGASSGLIYDNKFIREPGRSISNILYISH